VLLFSCEEGRRTLEGVGGRTRDEIIADLEKKIKSSQATLEDANGMALNWKSLMYPGSE
jgi:hypothetical protein